MQSKRKTIQRAFHSTFPHTIPIFAGSVEFVVVNMLLGTFNPLQALTMTFDD